MPRRREHVRHHPVLADQLGVRARGPVVGQTVAQVVEQRRVVDRREHVVVVRDGASTTSAPGRARAPRGARSPARAPRCPGSRRRPRPRASARAAGRRRRPDDGHRGRQVDRASSLPRVPAYGRMPACRALADLGIRIGSLPTGPTNSVLDVPGVGLGHATVSPRRAGAARRPRRRPHRRDRAASSADDAFRRPVPAGGAVLNGAGECTGFLTAGEWGLAETPVFLTSTMQLGRVYDAACELDARGGRRRSRDDVVIPVVGECDDSFLQRRRRMQVDARRRPRRRWRRPGPRRARPTPPDEGAVGAGTGMSCLGFKGGIGTVVAGRCRPATPSASLLMTNFGEQRPAHGRRRPGRPAAAAAGRGRPAPRAGRLVHRRRGHRRAARRRRLRAAGPPGRARPGPHRLDGPPRQRRDLPGAGDRPARRPRRRAAGRHPGRRAAASTRSSRPSSRRPRRRCSTQPARRHRPWSAATATPPTALPVDEVVRPAGGGTRRVSSRAAATKVRRSRCATASGWPPRSTCPTRRRAAAVPARGAALPQGRPDRRPTARSTCGCATSTATPSAASTSAAPARRTG